jgi:hypothetical protein
MAAEDDGFVLCTSYDGPSASTYLNVFDARDLGIGPDRPRPPSSTGCRTGSTGSFANGVV